MSRFALFSSQLGLSLSRFTAGLRELPRYFADLRQFRRGYKGYIALVPSLHDRHADAGSLGEYFWQDLLVARMIHEAAPRRHLDVGSRLDGFVAHLASFREVEFVDLRPLSADIPGVTFRQADLMASPDGTIAPAESVSCLHTIEHFGLGRYGDRVDPSGMITGLRNLAAFVAPGGTLYVSTPVGREQVEFNSHRISAPATVTSALEAEGLRLARLLWCEDDKVIESVDFERDLEQIGSRYYSLAIFVLTRPVA